MGTTCSRGRNEGGYLDTVRKDYVIFSRHIKELVGYQLSEEPGFMPYGGESGEHLVSAPCLGSG